MRQSVNQFQLHLAWLSEQPLMAGRRYQLILEGQSYLVSITQIKYKIDPRNGNHLSAKFIAAHEKCVVNVTSEKPIDYSSAAPAVNLLDADNHELLAQGNIDFALYRSTNIRWQNLTLDKTARARLKHQQPCCIWLTGLSGAGKSTIANLLEQKLYAMGVHTYLLDGDNVRHGLNKDLGFTAADRIENIRRVAEVAHLMVDAGLIVIASFISPFKTDRQLARDLFTGQEFIEIFVDAPLAECERRDVKGLYAKARRGELKNFTGIDSAYEPPLAAEVRVDTAAHSAEECVDEILNFLTAQKMVLPTTTEYQ